MDFRILNLYLFIFLKGTYANYECKNEHNRSVDWYVLYKLPHDRTNNNSLIRNGVAYTYITSDTVSQGWIMSSLSINSSLSAPGQTLLPLYTDAQINGKLWIMYNDQPPNGSTTEDLGHTKGVVLTGNDGGFWLVHSVPHFAPKPSELGYSYPETATHYGQSFICLTLSAKEMDLVGIQLTYNEPYIYSKNIPEGMESIFPNLLAAARNVKVKQPPWYHQQQLSTNGGNIFWSFAKAAKFDKELYSDWVAPTLQTNLLVESWRNGHGQLPSSCNTTFLVENISSLRIKVANIQFKTTHDHSKWATGDEKNWVCVGDINRMENQEKRGGGTICLNDDKVWSAYRKLVNSTEPCPHISEHTI